MSALEVKIDGDDVKSASQTTDANDVKIVNLSLANSIYKTTFTQFRNHIIKNCSAETLVMFDEKVANYPNHIDGILTNFKNNTKPVKSSDDYTVYALIGTAFIVALFGFAGYGVYNFIKLLA